MISKEVIATQQLSPVVETIFHWQVDDPSHCLLRIFVDKQAQQAYVVASKLNGDHPSKNSITENFGKIAQAVCKEYSSLLNLERINHVTWIAHYGLFSVPQSYENLGEQDDFSRIDIPWPLPTKLPSLGGEWTVLRPLAQEQLASKILLESVEAVVERESRVQ